MQSNPTARAAEMPDDLSRLRAFLAERDAAPYVLDRHLGGPRYRPALTRIAERDGTTGGCAWAPRCWRPARSSGSTRSMGMLSPRCSAISWARWWTKGCRSHWPAVPAIHIRRLALRPTATARQLSWRLQGWRRSLAR